MLSEVLQAFQNRDHDAGKNDHTTSFRPFIGNSAPLGASVPESVRTKIIMGDYVNLEVLLPYYKSDLS